MKPIDFKERNIEIAKDQDQYETLPAHAIQYRGEVVICIKLTTWERIRILFSGKFWTSILTFKQPLQPVKFSMNKREFIKEIKATKKEVKKDD